MKMAPRWHESFDLETGEGDPDQVIGYAVVVESPTIEADFWRWRGWVLMFLCRTLKRAVRLASTEFVFGGDGQPVAVVVIRRRYAKSRLGDFLGCGWVDAHRVELEDLEPGQRVG